MPYEIAFSLVSPGFEPRQRESKSLVLPLHHETTPGRVREILAPQAALFIAQNVQHGKPKCEGLFGNLSLEVSHTSLGEALRET